MCRYNFFLLELDVMKKQSEVDKKQTDELVRERDILNKNLLKVCSFFMISQLIQKMLRSLFWLLTMVIHLEFCYQDLLLGKALNFCGIQIVYIDVLAVCGWICKYYNVCDEIAGLWQLNLAMDYYSDSEPENEFGSVT